MGLTPTVEEGLTQAFTQDIAFAEPAVWLSLHSGNPGTTGINEITSGTGADGRQQVNYSGSAGTDENTAEVDVGVVAATVRWYGYWSAQTGGVFKGGFPMIGPMEIATAVSGSADVVCPAHGFTVGQKVRLYAPGGLNAAVPGGFTADTVYYVKAVIDANTITLSATSGGSVITPASSTGFVIAADQTAVFPGAGTLKFPAAGGLTYMTTS